MAWNGYSEQGQGSDERGPSTFAVNVPGVVQGPEGVEFVGVRAGGDMQSNGRVSVPTVKVDNTIGELMKLGEKFIAPKIKQEQDRRFIEGMSQAASGRAMQEIIDEQPAYVTIFGEAPAVEGARAYTTAARKSAWVAEQMNNMDKLARIDTADVGTTLHETIKSQMTGDPLTDAGITQDLLGAIPDLIRSQTKARFLYLQGEAKAARRTAMSAAAQEYSAIWSADDATRSQDQMDKAEQNLLNVFTPPEGVDVDSHLDDLTDSLAMQLGAGNFDATRLAYDTGIVKQLGPDRENKLRTAALRAAPQALTKVLPKLTNEIVALARNPPASTEEYLKAVDAINDKAAGLSRVPREYGQLLSEEYALRGVTAAANDMDRKLLAHQKKAATETKAAIISATVTSVIDDPDASGDLKFSTLDATMPGLDIKPAEVNAELGRRVLQSADPRAQANILNKFSGTTVDAAKDLVENMWNSTNREGAKWETHGAQFGKLLQLYESMNEQTRGRYFNKQQQDSLDAWAPRLATLSQDPEGQARDMQQLFESRNVLARTDTSKLRDKPDAGSSQAVVMEVLQERMTAGLFSGGPLDEDRAMKADIGEREMQAVTAIVMGGAQGYQGPAPSKAKAERAMFSAIETGLIDVHGGRLIFNEQADEAKRYPLSKAIGQNPDSTGMALDKVISAKVKARNGDDQTRFVIRAPGLPIKYIVTFEDKDGKPVTEIVRAEEVKATFEVRPPSAKGAVPSATNYRRPANQRQ